MKIVIPMSGTGDRFLRKGYKDPKPLIEVEGMPIIEHVVNMFSKDDEYVFICNREHLKETDMLETLQRIKPKGTIVEIDKHKYGPVYAVKQAFDQIIDDEQVIVNYCDFSVWWDYNRFKKAMKEKDCDGCITAYKDFHPHTLGNTLYGYIRWDADNYLLEIREKEAFTDNRMKEYASSGTYYFKKGRYVKKYFSQLLDKNIHKNGEYYVSLVYNLMYVDGLRTYIYELDHFLQWGTPEELREYLHWSGTFRSKINKQVTYDRIIEKDLTLMIPLAGEGSRFRKDGIAAPKPLINVSGNPMIIQAVRDLPTAAHNVFLCRKEHLIDHHLDTLLRGNFPDSRIIAVDKLTQGQACTCLLAEKQIDQKKPLLIGACDNGLIWNYVKYTDLVSDPRIDAIIWTFRENVTVERNPHMYGWVETDRHGKALRVSCKKPLSDDPVRDHAIVGTFYFRKAGYFFENAQDMVNKDRRINGEFYVDECMNELIEKGLHVSVFEVDRYLCWGTPNDHKTYSYWQEYFNKAPHHPYTKEKDEDFSRQEKK